jgi:hypothetical protein
MSGWVEVRWLPPAYRPWHSPLPWAAVIEVGSIIDQNSDMHGSLFGVRNVSLYRPLAADRGLPSDLSLVAAEQVERLRPHFATGAIGHASSLTWTEIDAIDWDELAQTTEPVGLSSVDHIATRRDALSQPWLLLFDLMRRLAQDYGHDNVRLVVWFDG